MQNKFGEHIYLVKYINYGNYADKGKMTVTMTMTMTMTVNSSSCELNCMLHPNTTFEFL